MKAMFFLLLAAMSVTALNAQQKENNRINEYVDLAATAGKSQGTLSGSYVHNWKLWKKRKWESGFSVRWTGYAGSQTEFITAPARLARTNTTPFLIFFAGQRKDFQDTLTVNRPRTSSVNLALNIGYNFSEKWSGGFNIDLIGFTFGKTSPAILKGNGILQTEPAAKPVSFNLLLTGDHDLGNLNSEFFIGYHLNQVWSLRAIYEFLFVEYRTQSVKQIAPDGTDVYRFRNKVNSFGVGVSYHVGRARHL